MEHYLSIALRAAFVDNMALAFFLGLCSFLAVSRRLETAFGLGMAVLFVMTLTCPLNQLFLTYVLREGALGWLHPDLRSVDLSFLVYLVFIGTIAATVQVVEIFMDRKLPRLSASLGVFLPLIAVNCAILGASLFMAERDYTFSESLSFSVGSGVGWALAVIALGAVRERLRYSNVPAGLRGLGITFIATGLMAMCFMAFAGVRL